MKRRAFTRRDFLKLVGAGTALTVPVGAGLGFVVFQDAQGDPIIERSPYVEDLQTSNPDGSVPILVVTNAAAADRFGAYIGEILRAEGLNGFHSLDLANIQLALLARYDVVILAETTLNASQAEVLEAYVTRGGSLIALKPDDRLAAVCGWERSPGGSSLSRPYLKIDSRQPACVGISDATLQLHDAADQYDLAGASALGWLYTDRATASEHPAIAMHRFGDGWAVGFAFNLARSIAYMRQGNPDQVNQDLDGLAGVRTVDMFVNWIDLERIHIPQADEQQRWFANIIAQLSRRPLPRLWYFPEDKKSILIVTGDSHSNPAQFIEEALTLVERYNGHMTIYYSPQIEDDLGRAERLLRFWLTDHIPLLSGVLGSRFGSPTPKLVQGWRARGHEITLHPYVEEGLEEWQVYWREFTGRGYGPISQTVRTHRILWSGWMKTAEVQARHGMRMNFDYYHVGPSLQKPNGEWAYGHLTGSGRPMKFIDEQGRLIDMYQQLTQIADEHLIPMDVPGWGGWPGLSPEAAIEIAKDLLDRSVQQGEYCAIGGQFHVDPFQLGGDPAQKGAAFLEGTLAYAQQLDLPIWSAQDWLQFSDARHETTLADLQWEPQAATLTFRFTPPVTARLPLTILLPFRHAAQTLTALQVDGVTQPLASRLTVGSVDYVLASLTAQEHRLKLTYS